MSPAIPHPAGRATAALLLLVVLVLGGTATTRLGAATAAEPLVVRSPGDVLELRFWLEDGSPRYALDRLRRPVVLPSPLGFVLAAGPMDRELELLGATRAERDTTWEQPWGEQRLVRDHHRELRVALGSRGRSWRMDVVFRLFDDGLGFRYEWPSQDGLGEFAILDESTGFALPADHDAWWFQAYQDNRYEYLYRRTPVSAIGTAHTPLTIETRDGLFLSIHEAALVDFASMTLARVDGTRLKADLVPWSDGTRVRLAAPAVSPWRTVQVADTPGGLVTSMLVLNLNEPSRIADTSWIRPAKYLGIWWSMHLGLESWSPGPKLGATTAKTVAMLEWAARHGFPAVLVEGWNVGWDQAWWDGKGSGFRFAEAQPEYDIEAVARRSRELGVKVIGHHETAAAIDNYESQLEEAFAFAARHGQDTVKTGYVGSRMTRADGTREWHHGQYGVRHYQRTVEAAARHRVMLNIHEPIKDTGLRRTWPNLMTREGARGMEYDAWSGDGGNPPEHHVVIPFTRGLAGPFDYTPGVVDLFYPEFQPRNRVNMTLAKGLALYVVIYSPLHMVADLPANLEGHPAMAWLTRVPTDWERTVVPSARIGDHAVFARQERGGHDWYVGAVTDEHGRLLEVPLSFLEPGVTYVAERFEDPEDGDWLDERAATTLRISNHEVTATDTLRLRLAPGGGAAIRLSPKP